MVELWSPATVVVVALNETDVVFAATVTEPGTVRVWFVFVKVTAAPPAGAALFKVTVQVLDAFGPRLDGLQFNDESRTGATRDTVVLAAVVPSMAVSVALWSVVIVAGEAAKVVVTAPGLTTTDVGAISVALVFDMATEA